MPAARPRPLRSVLWRSQIAGPALLVAAIVSSFAGASPAAAKPKQGLLRGLADTALTAADEQQQDLVFDEAVSAGAGVVRLNLSWRVVAGAVPPATPQNPADPSYQWGETDQAVREAAQRGLEVLFTITRAPDWAEGGGRPAQNVAPAGTWRPDPGAYGAFAQATATRYSGSFPDPTGAGSLPWVRYYQAWNEPNLSLHLTPQWSNGQPQSPGVYRGMLNAFFAGVKSVNPDNVVVTGGTGPYGDPPQNADRPQGSRVRPLQFVRNLLCVEGGACPDPPQLDVLAHHPINTTGSPTQGALDPDDISSPDLDRVRDVLRQAEQAGNVVPSGTHPLWVTEFWWPSNPPNQTYGDPPKKQARFIAESLYLFWRDGASAAINLEVQDNPGGVGPIADGSGIFFSNGTPKPAMTAFRFPFVAERLNKRKVRVWGQAPTVGPVKIQRKAGGRWRKVKTMKVQPGEVFQRSLRVSGNPPLRAAIGKDKSLAWRPLSG